MSSMSSRNLGPWRKGKRGWVWRKKVVTRSIASFWSGGGRPTAVTIRRWMSWSWSHQAVLVTAPLVVEPLTFRPEASSPVMMSSEAGTSSAGSL